MQLRNCNFCLIERCSFPKKQQHSQVQSTAELQINPIRRMFKSGCVQKESNIQKVQTRFARNEYVHRIQVPSMKHCVLLFFTVRLRQIRCDVSTENIEI